MIQNIVTGVFEENCYLVQPAPGGRLYVIDPGAEAGNILRAMAGIRHSGVTILLTHAHFDHIGAALAVQRESGAKCYLNPADNAIYASELNCCPPDYPPLHERAAVTGRIDHPEFEIIPTPGHTPGGTSFYFRGIPALFPGDTLFASSVGRTDLEGGDQAALMKSIREKLLVLPDDTPVYPGHGCSTGIGREKRVNPYL